MTPHEHARRLMVEQQVEGISDRDRRWLETHLNLCRDCSGYQDTLGRVMRGMKQIPVTASTAVVRKTQLRVLKRAKQLNEREQRAKAISVACAMVALTALVGTPLLHDMAHSLAQTLGWSEVVADTVVAAYWFFPAMLLSIIVMWLRPEPQARIREARSA